MRIKNNYKRSKILFIHIWNLTIKSPLSRQTRQKEKVKFQQITATTLDIVVALVLFLRLIMKKTKLSKL